MLAERDFKGVWIPREIWMDERLSAIEKVILTEIDSLDHGEPDYCWVSNENLAAFCQCSVTKVSNAVSKLTELGYIKVAAFDGRTRRLQSCLAFSVRQTYKNCKADLQKVQAINTTTNTTRDIKNTSYSFCAESQKSASSPTVYTLPLNDGTAYAVTQDDLSKYERLYPAVNVMEQLRKMDGWLDGHPKRCKTRQGIRRFINSWLSKAQDGGYQRESVAEKPAPQPQKKAPPAVAYRDPNNWWNGMTRDEFMDAVVPEYDKDGNLIGNRFPDGRFVAKPK